MKNLLMRNKGFTLIELLIVIALIGILAVALLSAINPLEQLRKGRDSARKADASELMNAIERFYTSYQCWPWNYTIGTGCASAGSYSVTFATPTAITTFTAADLLNLITVNELKPEFQTRLQQTTATSYNRLYVAEPGADGQTEGSVRVCVEPESATGRRGGLGQLVEAASAVDATEVAQCTEASYSGGQGNYADTHCYLCVPQ